MPAPSLDSTRARGAFLLLGSLACASPVAPRPILPLPGWRRSCCCGSPSRPQPWAARRHWHWPGGCLVRQHAGRHPHRAGRVPRHLRDLRPAGHTALPGPPAAYARARQCRGHPGVSCSCGGVGVPLSWPALRQLGRRWLCAGRLPAADAVRRGRRRVGCRLLRVLVRQRRPGPIPPGPRRLASRWCVCRRIPWRWLAAAGASGVRRRHGRGRGWRLSPPRGPARPLLRRMRRAR